MTVKNYEYGNGGFLTLAAVDAITAKSQALSLLLDSGAVGRGAAVPVYQEVLFQMTDYFTVYEPGFDGALVAVQRSAPKPGIDLAVYNWVAAASGINAVTTAAGDLVTGYTTAVKAIRGEPVKGLELSTASAEIGLALANGIIANRGKLPDIIGLGAADAGPSARGLFAGIYSPWAGTALFSFFKDASAPTGAPFYEDWLLTGDTVTGTVPDYSRSGNPASPFGNFVFKAYLGTYELISTLEAYTKVSPLTFIANAIQGTATGSIASPDVTETQTFLLNTTVWLQGSFLVSA